MVHNLRTCLRTFLIFLVVTDKYKIYIPRFKRIDASGGWTTVAA
jgi:hypothetical protein